MNSNRSTLFRLDSWRRGRVAGLVVLAVLAVLLGSAAAGAAQPAPLPVAPLVSPPTDQIIVRFRDTAGPASLSPADTAQLADRLSAAAGVSLSFVRPMSGDAYVMRLPERMEMAAAADVSARLAALPDVEYAEPDAIMQIVQSPPLPAGPASTTKTPNDPRFVDQWHYRYEPGEEEGLNLLPAWNITTGAATTVVAVVDTGIRSHADLAGRTLPGYDFIADIPTANDGNGRDADPADPGDWTTNDQCFFGWDATDSSWHGTHVAGTIGAASNNNSGVAGVNWLAKVVPVRVLGRCGGYLSDIVDGTRWAGGLAVPGAPVNANPADVINLSLGGSGSCSASYQNTFNQLAAAGVVVIVAAGNSNANASGFQPANCNQVITVAANDMVGDRAYYSNYGAVVDITAPGGAQSFANDPNGVLSTLNAGLTGPGADALVYYQGTSMAAPHVAGLASLLLGEQPDLTPAEVLDILQTTARDFPAGSSCTPAQCGPGIADAFAALTALDAPLVAPTLTAPANGATVATAEPTLSWSAVGGADAYQVQVSENAAFSAVIVNEASVTGTTKTVTLPGDGDYWWRVRAKDGAEIGPWSAIWRMTVEEAAVPDTWMAFLPLLTDVPYVPPPKLLENGDFEQGAVAWSESSSQGFPIILHLDDEEDMITHGGVWAAWLGGLDDEQAELIQEVTVPADTPYLTYYYLLNSGDICGFDYGRVMIGTTMVKQYNLCQQTTMTSFERAVIDLSEYGGEKVTLAFTITTDGSGLSSFFVDDVAFAAGAAATESPAGGAPLSAAPRSRD